MKKLAVIASILLVCGILMCVWGFYIAKGDNVNTSSIYALFKSSIAVSESNVEYIMPEKADLTNASNKSTDPRIGMMLNEFSTLDVYAENCTVEFNHEDYDNFSAAVEDASLKSGIIGGKFRLEAVHDGSGRGVLTIGVPGNYKGGCIISGVNIDVNAGSFDSAMDISINIYNGRLESSSLKADNISILASGSEIKVKNISAVKELTAAAVSSDVNIGSASARHCSFTLDNGKAVLGAVSGSCSIDAQTSSLDISLPGISGNISLDINTGKADIKLPRSTELNLIHSETYSLFRDKTNRAQNNDKKKAQRYTMETNIKYGVVTLTDLE